MGRDCILGGTNDLRAKCISGVHVMLVSYLVKAIELARGRRQSIGPLNSLADVPEGIQGSTEQSR